MLLGAFVSNNSVKKWAGKWVLVTGASAGIGLEIARQLAAAGANLVLTARRTDRLQSFAAEFSAKHNVKIEICGADLIQPSAPDEIFAFTSKRGIEVELLVNNAGFGEFGRIDKASRPRIAEMIQVNCTAVVALTQLYAPSMIARRSGDILIVASVAGFQAVPFHAAYAGTKAFDLLFAEAVAEELRPFG